MSEWTLSASMMRDPWRTGIDRVVAGQCQLLRSEYHVVVLWIYTGILIIPLFKIDIPTSSECIRFGSKFSGMEWITRLNLERYSDQCAFRCVRILVIEKYCKFW